MEMKHLTTFRFEFLTVPGRVIFYIIKELHHFGVFFTKQSYEKKNWINRKT
jgi:hypothetical protein